MQQITDEQVRMEARKYRVTDEDIRFFGEASKHHTAFIEIMRVKKHGEEVKQQVMHHAQAAENMYLQLLNEYPFWEQLIYQLATLYLQSNRNGLTIRLLDPLASRPDTKLEWVNNLGAAFRNEHHNDAAAACFQRALSIERNPDVLANLCALWVNEGYPEKGIPYGRECLALSPMHNQGQWNLGLLLLEKGEWEEGFKFYARGFDTGERLIREYLAPDGTQARFWKGEDLNGKTIVLFGEQGIGDELLFLQFVPELCKQYPEARVYLDVHPRLYNAIVRSLAGLKGIVGIHPTRKADPTWNAELRVDYKDGIGSLPAYYWKAMSQNAGWLKPDPELLADYRDILYRLQAERGQQGKMIVGISWEGGKKKTRNDLRSIELKKWLPILSKDCTFVSLQYTPDADKEVSKFYDETGITIHHWPDVTERFEYDHAIACIGATDLVISVNTSVVHVCGSMDHPCWTATPHGHAWRYGRKEEVNPFYKSVRQFHQGPDEAWHRIINKIGFQLGHEIRSHHGKQLKKRKEAA